MRRIGFIGAGTVGTALAVSLSEAGYHVVGVGSRTRGSAEQLANRIPGCRIYDSPQAVADACSHVFITTPDDAIAGVAASVQWREKQAVVHCSGALSTDVLRPAEHDGAQVGTFHPLQSFAALAQALQNLPGSAFAIEGEQPLRGTLAAMAKALRGQPVVMRPGDKVLYHAAAVIVSNYTVALMKMATDLWQQFGVPTDEATAALLPLLKGTVNNIEQVGLPNCLTGPIARGDAGTVRHHLDALERRAPELVEAYCALGRQALKVSRAKGKIAETQEAHLQMLLAGALLKTA